MNTFNKLLISLPLIAVACFGQVTTTQTTLSTAVTSTSGQTPTSTICVASSTGIVAPGFAGGFAGTNQTELVVDHEAMMVQAATASSTCWIVSRGWDGTRQTSHANAAVVWVGPPGSLVGSPFTYDAPIPGTPCTSTLQPYLPRILIAGSQREDSQTGWAFNCSAVTGNVGLNTWTAIQLPINGGSSGLHCYAATDAGATNAVTALVPGLPQVTGACVTLILGHTLQAGANTFALNAATAVAIRSHFNQANTIGTAYAATGTVQLLYNGTYWLDLSQ